MKGNEDDVFLRDIPVNERPRERMMNYGANSLSNSELVALLLRTGSKKESVISLASRVLTYAQGLKSLTSLTYHELSGIYGVGPAKAIQLLAGIELGRRIGRALPLDKYQILTPNDAAEFVMEELQYESQEHFLCVFLDTKNRVINKKYIFKGTLNSSLVHPREIFREAIRHNSASVVCYHNHPSGDPTPSAEDIKVTRKLLKAGSILGIRLVDHVIIGDHSYFSMKEKGFLADCHFQEQEK
jgi:DNA repair protein RadC